MNLKKRLVAVLSICMVMFLSGCVIKSAEDLYSLPKHSYSSYSLQNALDRCACSGTTYSAPVSGENRQSVQMQDLDGDGIKEAIAFFRLDAPLSLQISIFKLVDDFFDNNAVMKGSGSLFYNIKYADLDGCPGSEIILIRQFEDGHHALSVFKMLDSEMIELLSMNCAGYCLGDFTADGHDELLVVSEGTESFCCSLYSFREGTVLLDSVSLKEPGMALKNITFGSITGGNPAAFVAFGNDAELFTSVLRYYGSKLLIISDGNDSFSSQAAGKFLLFAHDIDSDGCLEIPEVYQTTESGVMVRWYSQLSQGSRECRLVTFHSFDEGWFLRFKDDMDFMLEAETEYTEFGICETSFYRIEGTEKHRIFSIAKAGLDARFPSGYFLVSRKGIYQYFANISDSTDSQISEDALKEMFDYRLSE